MVRVANLAHNKKAIIKDFNEDIKDISFAYIRQEIILGIVDSEGNILIYKITEKPDTFKSAFHGTIYIQILKLF